MLVAFVCLMIAGLLASGGFSSPRPEFRDAFPHGAEAELAAEGLSVLYTYVAHDQLPNFKPLRTVIFQVPESVCPFDDEDCVGRLFAAFDWVDSVDSGDRSGDHWDVSMDASETRYCSGGLNLLPNEIGFYIDRWELPVVDDPSDRGVWALDYLCWSKDLVVAS